MIPATSLESQLNNGNNKAPQHKANIAGSSNPGGAMGGLSATDLDITFIQVHSDCKFTQLENFYYICILILFFTLILLAFHSIRQCHHISQLHWSCWPELQWDWGGRFKCILGPLAVYCWRLDYHNRDPGLDLCGWHRYGMQVISCSHLDMQGCSPYLSWMRYYLT